jgi:hypothetical protein
MHVQQCGQCADVARIADALSADRATVSDRARVPAAGQVWWRATVRARMDLAQAAARPITWAQGAAAACAVGVVCAVIALAWSSLSGIMGRAAVAFASLDPGASQAASSMLAMLKGSMPLMLGVAGVAMIAPLVVLYLALSERE